MRLLFLLSLSLLSPQSFASELSPQVVTAIESWINKDQALVTAPEHASQALIHTDAFGVAIKTEKVAVVIHGLYNSPLWMEMLSKNLYDSGMNVLSLRLPGHFEHKVDALDAVDRSQWIYAAERALLLAQKVGDQVILVGHSLGGLIATRMAVDHNRRIAGLVLMAPAFSITTTNTMKSIVGSMLGMSQTSTESLRSRYISPSASNQARYLYNDLVKQMKQENNDPIVAVTKRLQDIPALVFNTEMEATLNLRKVLQITNAVIAGSIATKTHIMIPATDKVEHRDLATGNANNAAFPKMLIQIHDFLEAIPSSKSFSPLQSLSH